MANKTDLKWETIVNITYEVTQKQEGRGHAFGRTLARALDVAGEYAVCHNLYDYSSLPYFLERFKRHQPCEYYIFIIFYLKGFSF